MIRKFLKLSCCLAPLTETEIGFATNIDRVKRAGLERGRSAQLVERCALELFDRLGRVLEVKLDGRPNGRQKVRVEDCVGGLRLGKFVGEGLSRRAETSTREGQSGQSLYISRGSESQRGIRSLAGASASAEFAASRERARFPISASRSAPFTMNTAAVSFVPWR